MKNRNRVAKLPRIRLISAAVASCFASHLAFANPTGPIVVNGQVTFHQQGNLLQVTNSPGSIINWQSFSIGANELTRFLQQSPSSAVLNRVVTQNPSAILGALQSNGRVFLINPNGILFGAGAQIDVAGLVASTLKLSDADFLAGRMRFTEVAGAGSVINQGAINTAQGGQVYLVGPAVTNQGIITSPKGEVILAAGNRVELVDPGTPNLRVEITAPDNQAVNLGTIVADAGRVGIHAGLINQSGTIRADSAVVTEDGRIVLRATKGVNLEAGSVTAASGLKGGNVTVETETGSIRVAGQLDATGSETGGAINISVTGATGGIDLGSGLNTGNASVSLSGPGSTTTLNADIITAGADITINDSVVLGAPASITLDTTGGGAAGGNITITGTLNDDSNPSGLVLNSGSAGANTLGGAVGDITPIANLAVAGSLTAFNGGLVNTTGNQTYNGPVTLGVAMTFAATAPTANIAINNSLSGGANNLTMNAGGDITIRGNVSSGLQTVNAGGGLIVQGGAAGSAQLNATAGQIIGARFIEVTAQNGNAAGISNSISGDQVITVAGGGSSPGIDVQSLASGGQASIGNNALGAVQTITVTDADHINVNGFGPNISNVSAIIHAIPGTQTISITGSGANAINIGSAGALGGSNINARNQSITAGATGQSGSINIVGPAVNSHLAAISTNLGFPGAQTVSTSGALTVTGGNAPAQNFISGVNHNSSGLQSITASSIKLQGGLAGAGNSVQVNSASGDQAISVTGGGTLALQGGLGGADNFARIRNNVGNQNFSFPAGGAIEITGGNGPNIAPDPLDTANNFARIENRSLTGMQTINTGTITLNGGLTGINNFTGIQAAHQLITTSGDVTLHGGPAENSNPRIGAVGNTSPTNLVLNVGGALTLNGGTETGGAIGANREGGQPTTIVVTAVGDIALNPSSNPGANPRIGSFHNNVAGGDIILTSYTGNITLNSAGPGLGTSIRTLGDITMNAPAPGKGITEGGDSVIQANKLTTLSAAGTNLGGANQLAGFSATNTTSGPVTLNNASSSLTVNGVSQVPTGPLTINQDGHLVLTGTITSGPQSIGATGNISVLPSSPAFVNAFGPQAITAGGGLIVQSSAAGSAQLSATGGQTIDAAFVEVTAQNLPASIRNNGSGNQLITTSGMNAAGEGLALRTLGGIGATATIGQDVAGGQQVINVNNADRMTIDGAGGTALIIDNSGIQRITIRGAESMNALNMGSPGSPSASQIGGGGTQTVTAGLPGEAGSITIHGKAAGSGGNSIIVSSPVPGGTQTISTSGTLTVIGGNSPAGTQGAGIFANGIDGQQRVNAGGIALQGGAFGDGNNAAIGANNGTQEINAGAGGLAMVGGGIGATNSSAVITGATQIITSGGDVILLGGPNSGNSIRIGGRGGATPSPTDLALHAAGGVVLTSGSASGTAAVIGNSNVAAAQPSDISINAGGSVILNASSQSGSRIGQSEDVPGAGGDISITAGGNIQLNGTAQAARIRTEGNVDLQANQPGGMISSSGNAFVRANQLTTTSRAGTGLAGPNQVAAFNAVNTASGDLSLTNTSPLLTVTGVSQVPSGSFTLNQVGDLAITGNVFSGPQTISATGDMVVGASGNPVILYAAGPQGVNSSGTPHTSWPPLGVGLLDRLAGHGPIDISARSLSVRGGNTLGSFTAITGGPISITTTGNLATGNLSVAGGSGLGSFAWVLSSQDIDLTVGGNLTLSTGTGLLSFARMQTVRPTSLINVHFPNLSEGGYFVNGIEGAYRNGLTGFFAGPTAAKPGLRLITTYGE